MNELIKRLELECKLLEGEKIEAQKIRHQSQTANQNYWTLYGKALAMHNAYMMASHEGYKPS